MKKAIGELWKIFLTSIRDIQEPIQRYFAGMGIILLVWLVFYSFGALIVHGIVDLIEVIGTTITETVNGVEEPKL